MSRLWLLVCLLLLLAQAFTVWLGRRWSGGGAPAYAGDAELLSLARLTNAAWEELAPAMHAAAAPAGAAEELLARESLILRLRETEAVLRGAGTEARLAADFEAWLAIEESAPRRGRTATPASMFLTHLLDCVENLRGGASAGRVRRLALHPDTGSEYPCLAFELAGEPAQMGQTLLSVTAPGSPWRLAEMDLYRPGSDAGWWMRGSYTFSPAGAR